MWSVVTTVCGEIRAVQDGARSHTDERFRDLGLGFHAAEPLHLFVMSPEFGRVLALVCEAR
jgi:hypothetical protein